MACSNGSAHRPGDALHHRDAGKANEAPGHPVQRDEVGRVSHVVIRLDHQHLGEQFALREVPIRRRETLIGRGIGRLVLHGRRSSPGSVGTKIAPSMTTAALAARIGTGHRTTLAPIRR